MTDPMTLTDRENALAAQATNTPETAPTVSPSHAGVVSHAVAKACIERMEALGLKAGVKRDNACLDFYCGAASALEITDHTAAQAIATQAALIVAVRGYPGVQGILRGF
jgi:hypothetical protein